MGLLSSGLLPDMLNMRAPCFLVCLQGTAAQFLGKVAYLTLSELDGFP